MRSQPRSGKRRHVLRWVAVAAVVVVAGGTLVAYLKYRAVYDSITRVTVPSTALGHRPPVYSTDSENILVYGDDTRSGLTPHQQFILHAGHDQTNNTDTIMLVHISPGHHGVTAVSIPRDTMVPEYECDSGPGYTGQQANPAGAVQINSLLQIGGPTCLWKTVEQMSGVHIDHFIGIGLLGFVKVVNDLGGVNVCVPFTVKDQLSGLNLKAGEQHITGIQALAFWRTREDVGDGSDLQRIQRDQFMSAQVVKGVLHSGLLSNPIRLLRIVSDAAASMTTDDGMTVTDLVQIAQSFRNLAGQNVQFITMPNGPWIGNGNRVQPMQPQAGEVFSAIARDKTVPKVLTNPGGFRHRRCPGAHHQPGQRQGRGAERFRDHARRQPGGRRADQPRLQCDRHRRRAELRLPQVGHRVLHGRRHARGEHAHEAAHQRHLAAGVQPHPGHGRPDPRLRLHRSGAAGPARDRNARHRVPAGVRGREPVRLGIRVRGGRPGPVQRRDHRRRGVHRRRLRLLRPAQSLIHWP